MSRLILSCLALIALFSGSAFAQQKCASYNVSFPGNGYPSLQELWSGEICWLTTANAFTTVYGTNFNDYFINGTRTVSQASAAAPNTYVAVSTVSILGFVPANNVFDPVARLYSTVATYLNSTSSPSTLLFNNLWYGISAVKDGMDGQGLLVQLSAPQPGAMNVTVGGQTYLAAHLYSTSGAPSNATLDLSDGIDAFVSGGSNGSVSYVILTTFVPPPAVKGDPQFVGLRGQNFQVHGIDQQVYNLISTENTIVNARFSFLSSGECAVINGLALANCWSHPGSYFASIGVIQRIASTQEIAKLEIVAGPAAVGFLQVKLSGQALKVGAQVGNQIEFGVTWSDSHRLMFRTAQFDIQLENSDHFVNIVAIQPRVALPSIKAHGLLGQTSQAKVYKTAIRYIEGEVDEYAVAENDLFGSSFSYSQFVSSN